MTQAGDGGVNLAKVFFKPVRDDVSRMTTNQINSLPPRLAYSIREFAGLIGRHRSWAYRQIAEGRIRTVKGFGAELVPASEIERMLAAYHPAPIATQTRTTNP